MMTQSQIVNQENSENVTSQTLDSAVNTWTSLKDKTWSGTSVQIYIGYRKLMNKNPYKFFLINANNKIKDIFMSFLSKKLDETEPEFEQYQYVTVLLSEFVPLVINVSELGNQAALIETLEQSTGRMATEYSQLIKGDFYVVRYNHSELAYPLYAFRKLDRAYNPKPKNNLSKIFWKDGSLIDMDEHETFKIDRYFDYIVYGDLLYIFNQKNFEYILDIREELLVKANTIIEALGENIIDNPSDMLAFVGKDLRRLRAVAKIKEEGYCESQEYIEKMMQKISEKPSWNIQLTEDKQKIIVTKENMNAVFKVLGNSRLISEINGEEFDAVAKEPVSQ